MLAPQGREYEWRSDRAYEPAQEVRAIFSPGGACYESGPDAVFAQAADRPSRFIRVMVLPRELQGKSSIQYVNEDDKAKPKSQQYKIFADAPIAFAAKK